MPNARMTEVSETEVVSTKNWINIYYVLCAVGFCFTRTQAALLPYFALASFAALGPDSVYRPPPTAFHRVPSKLNTEPNPNSTWFLLTFTLTHSALLAASYNYHINHIKGAFTWRWPSSLVACNCLLVFFQHCRLLSQE